MSVSYAETAVKEIEDILDFLTVSSPKAADSLRLQLQEVEKRLTFYPLIGRLIPTRIGPMRRLVVQPYLLFYRTVGSEVIVIGLRHAARAPSSMPG